MRGQKQGKATKVMRGHHFLLSSGPFWPLNGVFSGRKETFIFQRIKERFGRTELDHIYFLPPFWPFLASKWGY
jgi:hypothetical protein